MATIAVISLVVLAGGSRRFEFLEKRISPVDASIVTAARDLIFSAKQLEEMRMNNIGNKKTACPIQKGFSNSIRKDLKTPPIYPGELIDNLMKLLYHRYYTFFRNKFEKNIIFSVIGAYSGDSGQPFRSIPASIIFYTHSGLGVNILMKWRIGPQFSLTLSVGSSIGESK